MKTHYHIYCIRNVINNKMYIGSSVNFASRWSLHRKMLSRNKHHSIKLQRAWNKYGSDSFIFDVIDSTFDKMDLIVSEQYYIDMFDSYKNGYNSRPLARSQLGFRHSEKLKR